MADAVAPSFVAAGFQPWRGKQAVQFDQPYQNFAMQNNAEMGAAGATVTNINSRSAGQSGFEAVNIGGSLTYDVTHSAHGTRSFLINNATNNNTNTVWGIVGSVTFIVANGQFPS